MLLVATCLGLLPLLPQSGIQHDDRASTMLKEAEELSAKGRWKGARNKLWNIQRSHPGTSGAEVASRRLNIGYLGVRDLEIAGPTKNRVDVMVMGDGYVLSKLHTFRNDAKDVPKAFSRNKTLEEYEAYFNFHEVGVVSKDNGVDPPGEDKEDTALGTAYTNRNRSHVSVNRRLVRGVLNEVEWNDGLAVVLVHQVELGATGGGGVATMSKGCELETICHEWGHAFAGLADEYDSDPGYTGDASESSNLALSDDPTRVPWAHFLQHKYYKRKVGVHRGGGGKADGTWKPTVRGCAMMNGGDFCPVCREQILLSIYRYVDPIDNCSPPGNSVFEVPLGDSKSKLEFSVSPMRPKSHSLKTTWWLLEGDHLITDEPERTRRNLRIRPLKVIDGDPMPKSNDAKKISINPDDLEPGNWTLVCRVEDDSVVGKHPWVLKDPRTLLKSERRWLIIK